MKKKRFTKAISVMISENDYQEIEKDSEEKDISISEYVRDAIAEKEKRNHKEEAENEF